MRRDQRQDARPGLVKMYAYHQPGPGGLPLGLASTEGLGLTGENERQLMRAHLVAKLAVHVKRLGIERPYI